MKGWDKYFEELEKRIKKLEKQVGEINDMKCPYDIKIRKGEEYGNKKTKD